MKEWYTAADLAGMPGLPQTKSGVIRLAKRESWPHRRRAGRGGGREYPMDALPAETKKAILARAVREAPAASTPPLPAPSPPGPLAETAHLTDAQRRTLAARAAILDFVDALTLAFGRDKAVRAVCRQAKEGTLRPDLLALVPDANARKGEGRTLGRASIYNWMKARQAAPAALAPKPPMRQEIPAWAPYLLKAYGQPQKPPLRGVVEKTLPETLPAGIPAPNYDQARRFLKTLSEITRNRGRMGPRALKALRAYKVRDTADLLPADVYTADGHTFDAEVQHPIHGRPFRPEITTVLDIKTRRAVGWSVALKENAVAVTDALRAACEASAIPAIWYTDNGPGYKNDTARDPDLGYLARLGVTHETSLPYASQSRGLIERFHRTCWVEAARALPTYIGAEMDREAGQNVFKLVRSAVKEVGFSPLLMPWPDFLDYCAKTIDAYNDRPHAGLPRVRDPRRRPRPGRRPRRSAGG